MPKKPLSNIAVQHALDIMKKLEDHPCSQIFKNTKRKKQMSIDKIKLKLKNREYRTHNEWFKDVQSIYNQAEQVNGTLSCHTFLANEFVRLFEKEVPGYVSYSKYKWVRMFADLNHKLQMHLHKMPENLLCTNILTASLNYCNPTDSIIEFKNDLRTEDINNFMNSLPMLTNVADAREMAKIVSKHHPGLRLTEDSPEIDIEKLSSEAIGELIDFSKNRFKKMKIPYPGDA